MSDDHWVYPPQPPAWPPAPSSTPSTPAPKRNSRVLSVISLFAATGILAAAVGVGSVLLIRHVQGNPAVATSPGGPSSGPTSNGSADQAQALFQQAVTATGSAAGFHYVSVLQGPETQTIVGDAGPNGGRQSITLVAGYGSEQFTLLLSKSVVYFQGNAPAVEDQLGVGAADAAKVAGKWVSVVSGNGPYAVLDPGITTTSQASEIVLTPSTTQPATSGGITATSILGAVPATNGLPAGTGHLVITPSSDLPLSYVTTVAVGAVTETVTTTFSAWGTAPTVSVPSGVVAWSTLATTVPPGGYGQGQPPSGIPTPAPTASGPV
jgi:hypothetical protein